MAEAVPGPLATAEEAALVAARALGPEGRGSRCDRRGRPRCR